MTSPVKISPSEDGSASPLASPHLSFLVPSPVPCKRTRTYSASERVSSEPDRRGTIKSFCREKGHGFVVPENETEPLFCHISDIDSDYVPKAGDQVVFKKCLIPPKMDKFSAVHVRLFPLSGESEHEKWDSTADFPQ